MILTIYRLEFGPAIFSELDSNPALNDPIDIYTVHFDFDQPVSGRLLRLEMEWTIRYQPSAEPEAQISSTRWLEFPPRTKDTTQPASSFLELYNLDFEKLASSISPWISADLFQIRLVVRSLSGRCFVARKASCRIGTFPRVCRLRAIADWTQRKPTSESNMSARQQTPQDHY